MSLLRKVKRAKRIYLIGNGGSYANAVHICNDLLGCGIKAHVLDPATLTAIANDYAYVHVFARWIQTVGEKGDLLIALSGSGTSKNILAALALAKRKGMATHLVTHYLRDGWGMQESEQEQLIIGHELRRELLKA